MGGGIDPSQFGYNENADPGIAVFELKYERWVEEQDRQISDLKNALHSDIGDEELRAFVDGGMKHYLDLFAMKAIAARRDVLYIMSGVWRTPAERFSLWIGGFRPSVLLKVIIPHVDSLSEQQLLELFNLTQSCRQAEDALSQGMEKLHITFADTISNGLLADVNYLPQIGAAMDKLEALVRFNIQAEHLRQETLHQMSRILTIRQAAQGHLALGEYLQRLRALSSHWSSRPHEQTE